MGAKRPVPFALAVIGAYMLVRCGVYAALPIHGFASWMLRDTLMSLPRLAAFAAFAAFVGAHGGWRRWGWSTRLTTAGALCLAGASSAVVLSILRLGSRTALPPTLLALGWLTSAPVALFEEAAFRAVLFAGLRQSCSARRAAVLSALAFTLYHVQAQGLAEWPAIFVFGVAACAALESGTGLFWLFLIHWILDALWFHLMAPPALSWATAAEVAAMAGTLAASWRALGGRPAKPVK